jgi:putative ABC transport system permease protein
MLADVWRDLRHGARSLARTPGFTIVAVAVLALGIGATSAIFSLVSAVWLKPLPFADAERVVSLGLVRGAGRSNEVTPGHYDDWRQRARSFEEITLLEPISGNVTGDGGEPERLFGLRSTANLFATIGLAPLIGRTFEADDGPAESVLISEGFWLRRFGGDPTIVGRTITLDGSARTVIGVVPRDFRFPYVEQDFYIAAVFRPDVLAQRGNYSWHVIAKLRADVSLGTARAEMSAIAAALETEAPNTGRGSAVSVLPLRDFFARSVTPTFMALLGAVVLVLLIACANVANLLLARATARQKELAIRKALGAARSRVLRQLLIESAVLAGAGVVVGLVLAAASFGYLTRLLPPNLPTTLVLDWRVLALTIGAALATVLLFGAGPAVAAARRDAGAALGRAVGVRGARGRRVRSGLLVVEIALTVVLLAGAGLLLRSYRAVLAVDPGFDAAGLVVLGTVLPSSRYAEGAARDAFYQRVLEGVRALPGVESAGYTNFAPLVVKGGSSVTFVEGRPRPEPSEMPRTIASDRAVSPGYLETLGVPLLRGRFIDERDVRSAPKVALINETMAQSHWPGEDPLGRRFTMGAGGDRVYTVVGIVGDVRSAGLDRPAGPELYVPLDQIDIQFMWPANLAVRAAGDPLALVPSLRRAIAEVDPTQPVSNVQTMSAVVDFELANRNTQLTLTSAFALLAIVLAGVGLYGTLSYTVSQSANEIGLRMALGARQGTVVGVVVRSALLTTAVGIAVGLVAAFALTRTIASFLYGVSPTDPATAAGVAALLLLVAVLAAFVPARRAANVDPMTALRAEG